MYWAEYWCAARGAWLELLAPDGRPLASENFLVIVDAAQVAAAFRPYRVLEESAGREWVVFQLP